MSLAELTSPKAIQQLKTALPWETRTLLDVTTQIMDFRGRTPKKLGMAWGGGDIPALSAANVKFGWIDFDEDCNYGSLALYKRWMTKGDPAKGDIVLTTEAPLGNVAQIPDNRRYILSQRTVLFKLDGSLIINDFLFQILQSESFRRALADNASGSTATGIQRKKLELLEVACPPIEEQQVIVQVLREADSLISSLEKLIAKKRDIKQAAMQQLLTGRLRLSGFNSKWSQEPLENLVEVDPENLGSSTSPDYSFNYIALEGVNRGSLAAWSHHKFATAPSRARRRIRPKDVLMSTVRPNLQAHLLFSESRGDWVCSTGFSVLRARLNQSDPGFIFFQLFGPTVGRQIESLIAGSNYPAISSKDVKSLMIPSPPLEEQAAIATVLSDMDNELASLLTRLAKLRDIKDGLMQQLLTGKVRLI